MKTSHFSSNYLETPQIQDNDYANIYSVISLQKNLKLESPNKPLEKFSKKTTDRINLRNILFILLAHSLLFMAIVLYIELRIFNKGKHFNLYSRFDA